MIGKTVGHYIITEKIGSGGMGDVYLARDSNLKRNVAVKVLPEAFASDSERIARFQREAEVLASLNHPHVAAIYDLVKSEDSRFLVLELVDGETLSERIARGPMTIDEALSIATQIAEALEAAHDKGIIHRDLKPSNIKITTDGEVKVLDFGLAKVREASAHSTAAADAKEGLSNSPTLMSATIPGVIMGTAAYMSPEQAKGREAGRSSDVWAFGCVLYEILTGSAVFHGETLGELLGEVFKTEPDWSRLPAETPQGIRRLLRRCLQKSERARLRDVRDVRLEIEEARTQPELPVQTTAVSRRGERIGWISVVLATSLLAAALTGWLLWPKSLPEFRLEIATPPAANPVFISLSPDGRKIIFAATSEGRTQLWVRALDATSATLLQGTDGATYPFWSADSRSAGFFADGKLKRIDVDSGAIQVLAERVLNGRGGSWNRDGVILYNELAGGPIFRVSATGGKAEAITQLQSPQQQGHRSPHFLPDGRHFLYYASGASESRGVYIGTLGETETRRLLDADTVAMYVPGGQLLFVRQEKLFAQNFDISSLLLKDEPFLVADQIAVDSQGIPALSVSETGLIAYRSGTASNTRRLAWFNRSGKEVAPVVPPPDAKSPAYLNMSADGQLAALQFAVAGNFDLWLLEISRNVFRKVTFDTAIDYSPLVSPDRRHLVYSSNRTGAYNLYRKSLAGVATEEQLVENSENNAASDWSRDGKVILYGRTSRNTGSDIWALPMEGERKPTLLVQTNAEERLPQFSPDAKWIAYESNETGRFEVYIQPFMNPGERIQVSTAGGGQVRWPDGKELFYMSLDGKLMGVSLRPLPDGRGLDIRSPETLFQTDSVRPWTAYNYVVSPDGQRFLINTNVAEATLPITVLMNWKAKP